MSPPPADPTLPAGPDAEKDAEKGERIAKRLARAGLCSRRDAERWIAEGRVAVDGKRLTTPAVTVTEDSIITVDGKPLPEAERTRLWRYHKPAGLVTSHKDPQGRPTVFERLPDAMPRVISVGRLDLSSEGLLLLTNDGALARRLELPTTGWVRRYRVRVHGTPDPQQLAALERGITVDGVAYGPIKALLDRQQGSNAWLTVSLKEGKNREIRRVMEHLGWTVSRLIRIAYGPFQLGLLEPGEADEVPTRVLQEQLGGRRAKKGGQAAEEAPAGEPGKAAARAPAKAGSRTDGKAPGEGWARSAAPRGTPGGTRGGTRGGEGKPHAHRRRPV